MYDRLVLYILNYGDESTLLGMKGIPSLDLLIDFIIDDHDRP